MVALEIIAETVEDAIEAEAGGASTLELVQNLAVGGLTPDLALVRAIRAAVKIPLRVIVRPHARDFVYSAEDIALISADIDRLKEIGTEGIVFGALRTDFTVDRDLTMQIAAHAHPMEVTFHRAIDIAIDADQVLPVLTGHVQRILTSGHANNAWEGRATLRQWIATYGDRCILACGGGIRTAQLADLVRETAAPEFHLGSAAQTNQRVNRVKVAELRGIINAATDSTTSTTYMENR